MKAHDYSFLRYCEDIEAGEFANIGVLFWCQQDFFLGFLGSNRYARLSHFFRDLERDGDRLLLAHVERRFDHMTKDVINSLPLEPLPVSAREIASKVLPETDVHCSGVRPMAGTWTLFTN